MALVVSEKSGPNGLLLVITDKDIMGKAFEEGKLQLDLSKEFYMGDEMGKNEVKKLLRKARDLHFTGKEAVSIGIEESFIESKNIIYVQDIPHAQVVVGE